MTFCSGGRLKLRHLQPIIATAIGFAIPAPLVWDKSFGTIMLYELALKPLGVLLMVGFVVLFFFERWPARRMTLLALVCLPLAGVVMFVLATSFSLGDRIRWFADRSAYKQRIATEPVAPGELRHFEWHEDGFGGINFFEYVVYDPSDGLADAYARSKDGRVPGVPCKGAYDLRFERGYHEVTFQLPWGDCD